MSDVVSLPWDSAFFLYEHQERVARRQDYIAFRRPETASSRSSQLSNPAIIRDLDEYR